MDTKVPPLCFHYGVRLKRNNCSDERVCPNWSVKTRKNSPCLAAYLGHHHMTFAALTLNLLLFLLSGIIVTENLGWFGKHRKEHNAYTAFFGKQHSSAFSIGTVALPKFCCPGYITTFLLLKNVMGPFSSGRIVFAQKQYGKILLHRRAELN